MNQIPSPTTPRSRAGEKGNILIVVLGTMVILTVIVGTMIGRASRAYRQVSDVATWQEALLASEMGADVAMAELRNTLINPRLAFTTWSTTDASGAALPNSGLRYKVPTLQRAGEGNGTLDVEVVLDAPPELFDASENNQWRRIRSTGTAYFSGKPYVTSNRYDRALRGFWFLRNRKTGSNVTKPQTTRLIELVAKPIGMEDAIVSDDPINLNNNNIIIDSYDSRYPTKSTNGLYDPTLRQKNGDIATNSQLIDAGSAVIYGDAYTNNGVIANGANITGEQRNDYYKNLIPVKAPDWVGKTVEPLPVAVTGMSTLTGGTWANPKRYILSTISLQGTDSLTVTPSAPGVESYTEVWLTGDLKTSGNGTITIAANANLKIFIAGNVDIKGNGTFNKDSQPKRLQLLGIDPSPSTRSMYFSGNGVFVGAVYAPDHAIAFGSTGSNGTYWGSLTGKSIDLGGSSTIHYDEALADEGYITDFRIKSWFEDVK